MNEKRNEEHSTNDSSDNLSRKEFSELKTQLDLNPVQADELVDLENLWNRLGAMSPEQPSAELQIRFDPILQAYEDGKREAANTRPRLFDWFKLFVRQPLAVATCAAVVLVSVLIGAQLQVPSADDTVVAALQSEVAEMKELMLLTMFDADSATERLNAIQLTARVAAPPEEILNALLKTLRNDSSVNVRLAAIDALQNYTSAPGVRAGLVESLFFQTSPLVQVGLIEILASEGQTDLTPILEELLDTGNIHERVEQRARALLRQTI